jgi:hypothetical protein
MSEPGDPASNERIRDAITLAKNMRNNGVSLETIEFRLVRRGFDVPAVEAVLRHVPKEEPNNIIVAPDEAIGGRRFLVILGLVISAFGLFFVFGNQTGMAPTLPFFGFAVMVGGGLLMAAGRS